MLLTFLRIKGAREAGLPRTGGWPAKLETVSRPEASSFLGAISANLGLTGTSGPNGAARHSTTIEVLARADT